MILPARTISLILLVAIPVAAGCSGGSSQQRGGSSQHLSPTPAAAARAFALDLTYLHGRAASTRLVSSVAPLRPSVVDMVKDFRGHKAVITKTTRVKPNLFAYRIYGHGPGKRPFFKTEMFTGLLNVTVARDGESWGVSAVELTDMRWSAVP